MYGGVEVHFYAFLISVLHGNEWSASCPAYYLLCPQYLPDKRVGGPPSQSGCGGEEKNHCPHWKSNPGFPPHTLVTVLTALSWL